MNPPSTTGIIETALYVADLNASLAFYQRLFGWEVLLQDDRIVSLAIRPGQVLLLFEKGKSTDGADAPGGHIPGHDALGRIHVAFGIERDALERWTQWLGECGVAIESVVHPPRGGTSLYFRDPDGHSIELLTPGVWPNY